MLDKYGFEQKDWEDMIRVFRSFPELEKVILFGSRALNTFKPGSDVDIALVPSEASPHLAAAVKGALEETQLPYFFDVVDYTTVTTPEFKEHIDRFGLAIYPKEFSLDNSQHTFESLTLADVMYPVSETYNLKDESSVHFLNTGDILDGKLLHNNTTPVKKLPGQAKKMFLKGDILYSEIRPENKRYMLVDFDPARSVASTKLMVLRPKSVIDHRFLYIFLTAPSTLRAFQEIAEARSGTFPQITFDAIAYYPIKLPSLTEQRRIVDVISSIDCKIDLLRRQNQTLEEIAQRLFREWFLEFNFPNEEGKPYREIGGRMMESKLGEIPEGWRVDVMGNVVSIKGGGTPSTANMDFWNGDVPWTSPKDLSNSKQLFIFSTEKQISEKGLAQISSGMLPRGTLLLSSRAPIGYLAISDIDVAINQGYIAFLEGAYFSNRYTYLWLRSNMKLVVNAANGSTFLEISKSAFKTIDCIVPPKKLIENFDILVRNQFERIRLNLLQIETLVSFRNEMLRNFLDTEKP